jgi:glycosyltransferase involved in cell wall biosynthesis
MKILHLSTYDRFGGACIAGYRQHAALVRQGVDSKMLVRYKVTNDPNVVSFSLPSYPSARVDRFSRRNWIQLQRWKTGIRGEMFDDRSEHHGHELGAITKSDVLNIQFAWEFLDYPKFFNSIPPSKPVVITMHEMSHFTGGCSYASGCTHFHQSCGQCPKIVRKGERDYSNQGWIRRKASYGLKAHGKLHFVADSHWLADEAKRSGLLSDLPVSVIHYCIDTNIFHPLDRTFARSVLGIPVDASVVSFAAASVNDSRKGMNHLTEALMGMKEKPFLLTWGRNYPAALESLAHLHLGNLDSEHMMALAYNASDVFVMPSLEEAFGQTALEAIACGTPVAAFSAGGIVDTVRHETTGLLSEVGNSDHLRASITRLLNEKTLWQNCSDHGIRIARNEFSMELNAKRYIDLYQSMIEN